MKAIRIALCTALLTLPIVALARLPLYSPPGADHAVLRFSWRMSVTAKENCRPRTQAELETLPVHMRTPEICSRDVAHYTLLVRVGDVAADTIPLVRRGVKGDRPLFVLVERALEPGSHRVAVELLRTTSDTAAVLADLDTSLVMSAGRVQLITLDDATGRLTARASPD